MEISRSFFHVSVKNQNLIHNSYIIKDEKIVIINVVEESLQDEWLENIENVLENQIPNYLIITTNSNINLDKIINKYPTLQIIDYHSLIDELQLGQHTLKIMKHIPHTILIYIPTLQVLISSYVFGTYGYKHCLEETRRYYFHKIGQYGEYTQKLLKFMRTLDIQKICPLHGPILYDIQEYVFYYQIWSQYIAQECSILIAYTTDDKQIAKRLQSLLEENGEIVVLCDLMKKDMTYAMTDAFVCDRMVLIGCDNDLPILLKFLQNLKEKNFQNREVALITDESLIIENILNSMEDIKIVKPIVSINETMFDQKLNKLIESLMNGCCDGEFCG